ncbi:condensin-2 complex subunit H2 isoform X1 [Mirounga angustirostris]|uniref:condensin-2 complex subunit H2 isoform X1 n=1 Tax=Mirounga angustirostris TaxID=9716 RepID=UPI00313C8F27
MEDAEARFAHLLQPIRDLTKNWEVDVAAQLGEYLEELDQICISFDEGKTTMNFIEAALLIQGSACVYSKKVEYLYSLVYQALDFISGKKRAKQLSSVRENGASGDTSSTAPQEVEDQFLSLDDLPDSRANVDLRNDLPPREVLIVPLLPMALVAPDEMEKNVSPLCSCQGEVLASRKDFRMNTSTPHPRGAFMLEPVGISPMETLMPRNQKEPERAEEQPMEVSVCSPVPVVNVSQEPGASPEGPMPGGGGEDEDAEGAAELPEATAPEGPKEPQEPRSPQQSAAQPSPCMLREREEPAPLMKETPDPWQSLDPFDSLDSKPFKKGRPYSVPPCVEEVPGQKRKRKGATKLQDFHQWYLAAYADHADSRRSRRKGPSFAGEVRDMEVLYWKHVKEQLETLRKLQRREMAERWLPRPEEGLWPVEDQLEDSLEDLGTAADDFLEPEEYAEPQEAKPGEAAELEAEAMPVSLSYEELVRRNVELFIATSQKFVQETELSQRIRNWEDTIQPLLQEQEQHVPFDIHTYGDQVVSRFSQLNQWCPFAELVAGQPAFEVCRSMLASLQLANDYTVEITQQPGLEAAVDTMSLRLLTHQRAHKRFQTYAAPSMAQP